ncbi:MAG: hypothetical protein ACXABC_15445 [Candidatus Thorarchaeota archaeon]
MNRDSNSFSWKGFAALMIILVVVSIIAYILSSIEGFLTGIIVIFIGFILSFFRDDLRRILGLGREKEALAVPAIEEENPLEKLEKKIAKGRKNLAKTLAEYDVQTKPKKRQKVEQEILEETTALIALLDQAKSFAIQQKVTDLIPHYDQISGEIEEIRRKVSEQLSG